MSISIGTFHFFKNAVEVGVLLPFLNLPIHSIIYIHQEQDDIKYIKCRLPLIIMTLSKSFVLFELQFCSRKDMFMLSSKDCWKYSNSIIT